jgi:hypothetical protein
MNHFGNPNTVELDPEWGYIDRNGNRWIRYDGYWMHKDAAGAEFSITESDMREIQSQEMAA